MLHDIHLQSMLLAICNQIRVVAMEEIAYGFPGGLVTSLPFGKEAIRTIRANPMPPYFIDYPFIRHSFGILDRSAVVK